MSSTQQSSNTEGRPDTGPESSWIRVLVWVSIVTAVVDLVVPGLSGAVIPPLAIGAALTVVGLVVLRRSWKAGVVILGVVSLVLVLASAPFATPNLAHPESPLSFTHAVIGMGGGLLAVVAAVGAWRTASPVGARRVGMVALGLLAITVVSAGVAALLTATDSHQAGDVLVPVRDVTFPDEVRVASGDHVLVENTDLVRHTFTVEGTDLSVELPERTNVRVGVDLPAGTYRIICAIPGHESMTTSLVVERR